MTPSRFLTEANVFIKRVRSQLQRNQNSEVYLRNKSDGTTEVAEWVAFWRGLPAFDKYKSKYNGWIGIIQSDIYLKDYFEQSDKTSKYASTLGGLF
ncbi:hypothetical protein FRX31_003527 [Thalictrum thalictroides]|uniref:Uncharacterized protein n=1 Tax=Thalictrum thalictroides TaxID=46969 RepID=A0A7J6XAR0_THATH|nr:hypothetical protein FRX31_003527 [Thalictrum thalictroides]